MRFPDLAGWLGWLETLHPKAGGHSSLQRVAQVTCNLGLMGLSCPIVSVAGTNGKGSCVALTEAVLQAAGYRVGAYFSPHLLTYTERIRIAGVPVAEPALCEAFAVIDQARAGLVLTYFEFSTLAALWLFKQAKLDAVVLEVGIGGRLDAVNVMDADIAIISTIALDHTQWLGTTREQIALEKAGILRRGQPAVCGDFAVPNPLREYAHTLSAPLYCQGEAFGYSPQADTWSWWNQQQHIEQLPLPKIDLQNAATVLQALTLLNEKLPIPIATWRQGLQQVFLAGRFQQLTSRAIMHILDVAHNPAAGEWLGRKLKIFLQENQQIQQVFAVVAMLHDKDHAGTLRPLIVHVDHWYVGGLQIARASSVALLAENLCALGAHSVKKYTTVTAAYQAALTQANLNTLIVVLGSFYTVGVVLQIIEQNA